jgi:hypothetical protein
MAGFELYGTEAELFLTRNRKSRRQPLEHRGFAQAADAIRFAIEEPAALPIQAYQPVVINPQTAVPYNKGDLRMARYPVSLQPIKRFRLSSR